MRIVAGALQLLLGLHFGWHYAGQCCGAPILCRSQWRRKQALQRVEAVRGAGLDWGSLPDHIIAQP